MWVKENTVLNLSCEASGHPRPSISWSVDGTVSPSPFPLLTHPCPRLCCGDRAGPLSSASFLTGP